MTTTDPRFSTMTMSYRRAEPLMAVGFDVENIVRMAAEDTREISGYRSYYATFERKKLKDFEMKEADDPESDYTYR